MSLTKATYAMISGAPLNVKDFGAVGDGTTDDTAAIQAAINAVTSTQRTVYIPGGTYKVTSTLTIPIEMTIYGTNRAGTNINYDGSGAAITTTADGTPNLSRICLSGFGIYNVGSGTIGINFDNVQDSLVSNVTIADFSLHGIYCANGYNNVFEQIQSTNGYGIYLGLEANANFIQQSTFLNNVNSGIFVGGGRANNIIGCDFEGNQYGVQVSGAPSGIGTKSLLIQGCYFEANTVYEIIVEKHTALAGMPQQIDICDNYFCGIVGACPVAIEIVDANNINISENDFDNQGTAYQNSVAVSGTGTVTHINWGFNKDTSLNGPSLIGTPKNVLQQSTAIAWGTFNGLGSVTLDETYNVTSIGRNSAGNYTVTINTSAPTSYCVVVNAENFNAYGAPMIAAATVTNSTTFNIYTATAATPNLDARTVSFVVFGLISQ